jgi:hypothetical protein
MSISIVCPSCRSKWKAPNQAADRILPCPTCGHKKRVVCKLGVVKAPEAANPEATGPYDHGDSDPKPLSTPPPQTARIVGVVMGAVGLLILAFVLVYCLLRASLN